jgi:glycosyltransferase involved in cell wall biosynthesis
VLPSEALEGFGYAALEASAVGCPVIASDLPVFDRLVQDERTGLRFRMGDARDLAGRLRLALDESTLMHRLGDQAAEHVRRNFPLDRMLANTLAVYRGLL